MKVAESYRHIPFQPRSPPPPPRGDNQLNRIYSINSMTYARIALQLTFRVV
jgi:hypothetical protein